MIKSDKLYHHFFQRYYDSLLSSYTKKNTISKVNILEVGVEKGFSIDFWNKYFDNVFITGIDNNPQIEKDKTTSNFLLFKGDQTDSFFLENTILPHAKSINGFDFIVDDGSHVPEHQIFTFNKLFNSLIDGGYYIIEDVETSYWRHYYIYGYRVNAGLKKSNNLISIFGNLGHYVNREFSSMHRPKIFDPTTNVEQIESITFGQNIIIIKKGDSKHNEILSRQYHNKKVTHFNLKRMVGFFVRKLRL